MRYLDVSTSDRDGAPRWSAIGLGTWQFGSREWGYGEDYLPRARAIVRRALELGITVFDSAEVYGLGRSERVLGEALGEDRERVVVASKIFPVLPVAPVVQQRAVASADRLGARRLDLYQVHQANPVVGDGTTMAGMRSLQDVGLVDQVGVSNYSLQRWQRAEAALGRRVLSNQVQYSLVSRGPDAEMVPWARETGHVVIAYSPLGQGLLSGKYDADHRPSGTVRAANPLFLPENLRRAGALVQALRDVADAHDVTPAQVALAWVVRHPHVVAIPGASSVEQLEHNAAVGDLVLADDEVTALTSAAEAFRPVTGAAAARGLLRERLHRS